MTEEIEVRDSKIFWVAFRGTLDYLNYKTRVDRLFDSYEDFYNFYKTNSAQHNAPTSLIISDLYVKASLIKGRETLQLVDVEETKDRLFLRITPELVQSRFEGQLNIIQSNYTIISKDIRTNHYKIVLENYKKITFFDQFNTFKYLISKELRADLEKYIYQFFIGILTKEELHVLLSEKETQLKASQLRRYQAVKSFLISDKADILRELVVELDSEVLKEKLDTHLLDYFDVNYLKAFLRDFGKTKEEKRKRKERVQSVIFTDSNS